MRKALADYGARHGGRFWIYGSAARGDIDYDSDVDILVDFEDPSLSSAVDFAEQACTKRGLRPDVKPKSWCTPAFIERIASKAHVLP